MIGHRCRDCMWWDNQHPTAALIPKALGKENMGFCRKHKPGSMRIDKHFYGVQRVTDAEEFCGEFRESS